LLNLQNSVYLENHLNTYGRFDGIVLSLEWLLLTSMLKSSCTSSKKQKKSIKCFILLEEKIRM
jgi:hypothetical protein